MNIIRYYFELFKFASRGGEGYYAARTFMAEITISELEEFVNLRSKKVLDVGGEFGDFCKLLAESKKCQAINLEPTKPSGGFVHKTIIGKADKIPFDNNTFDLVLLRGVLQHIPTNLKLKSLLEIKRVLKDGGILYIMIPPWYNPLSAQILKPFQYFGFKLAKHFRNSIFRSNIKANSLSELGLWPMTISLTEKLIHKANFKKLKTTDILGRMNFLTKIPILREFLLPSVGFILRK